jgi:hypothetical protein
MFCSFEGPPRIMRLHGSGTALFPGHEDFERYSNQLPANLGLRSIIHTKIQRASVSCGYSVPLFKFVGQRDLLDKWATRGQKELLPTGRRRIRQVLMVFQAMVN